MSGEKDVTIYDIARALNISAATVSRGLKDHPVISSTTKKKIFEAATNMGYRFNSFASNLRTKRTNTIGIIVPRLNSAFMSDVIAGIEKVANDEGFNLIISQSLETEEKEAKNALTMFNTRVDGLLVSLASGTKGIEHFEPFIRKDVPLIFFDRVQEHEQCVNIVIDNFKAASEITAHLISEGCRKILHISGNQIRNVYKDRFRGYREALAEHGIPFDRDWLIVNDLSPASGIQVAEEVLKMKDLPDALFFANDACAVSCLLALKRMGVKVPGQIAIAGFNNDPSSLIVEPNLTTINYKGFEMGEVAARMLIRYLNKNSELNLPGTIMLRHELLVRASSTRTQA